MTTVQRIIKYLAVAFAIFLIITIVSTVFVAISGFSAILGLKRENENVVREKVKSEFENTNISTLDIDIAYTNLIIKPGEHFGAETNNNNIQYKQDGNRLKITEKAHRSFFNINKENIRELIVYIPEKLELENVDIDTGAGKVEIEDISAEKFELDLGAGESIIQNINANKVNIEGGAGRLVIEDGTINNLDFDMGVGEANISAKLLGSSEIDTGVGKLDLKIKGIKDDYKIKVNKGIGSIKIDNTEVSDGSIIGNGANIVELDGGVGSITVSFD